MDSDESDYESELEFHDIPIDNSNLAEKKTNIFRILSSWFQNTSLDFSYITSIFQNNNSLCTMRQNPINVLTVFHCILKREHHIKMNEYELTTFTKILKPAMTNIKTQKEMFLPERNDLNVFNHIVTCRVNGFAFFAKNYYHRKKQDLKEVKHESQAKLDTQTDLESQVTSDIQARESLPFIPFLEEDFLLLQSEDMQDLCQGLEFAIKRFYLFAIKSDFFASCTCQSKEEEVALTLCAILRIIEKQLPLTSFVFDKNSRLARHNTEAFRSFIHLILGIYRSKKVAYQKYISQIDSYISSACH